LAYQQVDPIMGAWTSDTGVPTEETKTKVMEEEVLRIMDELRDWCRSQRGRQQELADYAGVKKQIVYNWLEKKSLPSWAHGMQIQEFLRKKRRQK
jgi:hypothetical protein